MFQNHLTQIITPRDPRAWRFEEAIKKEIEGLMKKGTFKIVFRGEIKPDVNIFGRMLCVGN